MCAMLVNGEAQEPDDETEPTEPTYQLSIPPKHPYEGKATLRQKHKIWDLGYREKTIIDNLGKQQASAVIDQLLALYRKENKRKSGKRAMISGPILLVVGTVILVTVERFRLNELLLIVGMGLVILGPIFFFAGLLAFLRSFLMRAPKKK